MSVDFKWKEIIIIPVEPCASEGENYSKVYTDEYPSECCSGLTEWASGMDSRVSVMGKWYSTGLLKGSPIVTCINCGDGTCKSPETVCNCPKDCPTKSEYDSVEAFCEAYGGHATEQNCENANMKENAICDFCYIQNPDAPVNS